MNILVLGGTGFLGKNIVEMLIIRQYPVTVLTRDSQKLEKLPKKISYVIGDLLKYEKIDFSIYTHIINCSGELKKEELMQDLHVRCINGILKKIQQQNPTIHWIQISSVGVYGKVFKGKVVENFTFNPTGLYEVTKADGELLVKQFCLKHKINYTIIRPSNVFGSGMPNQSLAQLITMIEKRLFFYIGSGKKVVMNYVPVEDVALLTALCINNQAALNEEFIISDYILLEDFIKIICEELKIENNFYKIPETLIRFITFMISFIPNVPLTKTRIDALTLRVKYSTEKAATNLNYKPLVGCASGLRNYVSYLL